MPDQYLETGVLALDERSLSLVGRQGGITWFKSHTMPLSGFEPAAYPTIRFVTVLRNPRDVLVSAASYLAWLDVKLGGLGPAFAALSEAERIANLISDGDFLLNELEAWSTWPHATRLHYENLIGDVDGNLQALLSACNLEPRPGVVERAARVNSFAARSGRRPGEEVGNSFLRKGIAGDWQNKFDEKCLNSFATAKHGRWLALEKTISKLREIDHPNFVRSS